MIHFTSETLGVSEITDIVSSPIIDEVDYILYFLTMDEQNLELTLTEFSTTRLSEPDLSIKTLLLTNYQYQ